MKGSTIALDHLGTRHAAALMVDGALEDLIIDPPDWVVPPETLFRGKLGRPMKGMGGAFVDLPDGRTGFLRQTKGVRPGAPILVQVAGLAENGKAVPVTSRLLFKSRYAIVTPDAPGLNISRQIEDEALRADLSRVATESMQGADPSMGLILRSACANVDDSTVAEDIAHMRNLSEQVLADIAGPPELLLAAPDAHELAWRDWAQPDTLDDQPGSFDRHGVADALDRLAVPEVPLAHGASMIIEATRAVVAVDVNTGNDTSQAAGLKANIAAIRALPRELRLRGLGGQVLIDLAPYPKRERQVLEQCLRAAFRTDGRDTVLAGFTPLGNFELTRKRDRVALDVLLS
jgi:Ribonuclease G/E